MELLKNIAAALALPLAVIAIWQFIRNRGYQNADYLPRINIRCADAWCDRYPPRPSKHPAAQSGTEPSRLTAIRLRVGAATAGEKPIEFVEVDLSLHASLRNVPLGKWAVPEHQRHYGKGGEVTSEEFGFSWREIFDAVTKLSGPEKSTIIATVRFRSATGIQQEASGPVAEIIALERGEWLAQKL